jgi:hypothetical protein
MEPNATQYEAYAQQSKFGINYNRIGLSADTFRG